MRRLTLAIISFCLALNSFAQFESLNGPEGGIIWEIFESSAGYKFALTDNSGIYRSDRNLESWQITSLTSSRYKMSETPDGRLYAVNNFGLYLSYDSGLNFERVNGANNLWLPKYIEAVNDSVIIILSENPSGRIFRSSDHGENWETVFDFNSYFYFNCLTKAANGTLFATAKGTHPDQRYARVLRSTDDGASWQELNYGEVTEFQMSCLCDSNNNVYLESTDNIYKSTDNGDSWSTLNTPFSLVDIFIKNTNDNLHVFDMDGDHYMSDNGGLQWINQNFENPQNVEMLFYYLDDLTITAVSKGFGIYQSTFPVTEWVSKCDGLTASHVNQLAVNGEGIVLSCDINSSALFRSDRTGQWHRTGEEFKPRKVFSCSEGHFYCSDFTDLVHHIYHSTDNAQNWNEIVVPEILRQADLTDLKRYNNQLYIAVNSYGGALFRSNDEGLNWEEVQGINPVKDIEVGPNNELYVSNDRVLCKYRENGTEWDTLYVADEFGGVIWQFTVDPSNGNIILSDRQLGIRYSTDGGQTWDDRNDLTWLPLDWYWFRSNSLETSIDGTIYLTAEIDYDFDPWHIYLTLKSSDGGLSWGNCNEGMVSDNAEIFHLGKDGNLYAGTYHGVYKKTILSTVDNLKKNIPSEFSIRNVYPNPFNSTIEIVFYLDKPSVVNMKIFDVLGREVFVSNGNIYNQGKNTMMWQAAGLEGLQMSSGIYFVSLKTNKSIVTKRITFLK